MSDTKKENYMALEDFKTLWDNKLKPVIPELTEYATVATCESIIDELN